MAKKKIMRCSYCGKPAVLKPASEIFHDDRKGYVCVCRHYPACDAYVCTYPDTKIPMGTLANAPLRKKRILAHQSFDQIWKRNILSRDQAYRWLADKLGIPLNQTHIALFGDYLCDQVISESRKVLVNNKKSCVA